MLEVLWWSFRKLFVHNVCLHRWTEWRWLGVKDDPYDTVQLYQIRHCTKCNKIQKIRV